MAPEASTPGRAPGSCCATRCGTSAASRAGVDGSGSALPGPSRAPRAIPGQPTWAATGAAGRAAMPRWAFDYSLAGSRQWAGDAGVRTAQEALVPEAPAGPYR